MKLGTIKKSGSSLSRRTLLVSVKVSQWVGRKFDQKATQTANVAHKAHETAGSYNKKLLPAARELEAVSTLSSQIRKYFYEQTLPWMNDGTRIIHSKNYLKFQEGIRKYSAEFDRAVKEFEKAYPRLKKEAQVKLGDLFNPEEYPEEIAERFSVSVDFHPFPDSRDFRVQISETQKKEFERKMKSVENKAMLDASERLLSTIKAATEKLKDPKAIFRDSLLDNVREMADLIPVLNISESPTLQKLGEEAKELVESIDMKDIRKDHKKRAKAQKDLKAIESQMGAFMGTLK